jgi:hypothetical protein
MEQITDARPTNHGSSCSPFWIASTCLSAFNGWFGRKKQLSTAEDERAFQMELTQLKEQYEDSKEILEVEFKRYLKEIQKENENIQSELKFNLELEKDELKMFVKGWPLKLALQKVQRERETVNSLPHTLTIIVAKHTGGTKNDILSHIYDGASGIVDNVQNVLKTLGIADNNILRFKENEQVLGGAALANIYSMLSVFPTVVILPRIDKLNNRLNVSVGCWFANSRIPSQRTVFSLDYDDNKMSMSVQYKTEKQKEIEYCYIAIAAVMNDVYSLLVNGTAPQFPSYANSKGLLGQYPLIKDFVRNEYQSIIDKNQTAVILNGIECDAMDIIFNDERKKVIQSYIVNILNSLK